MMTRNEAYDLISTLNETAHEQAWESWIAADEEEDYEASEELREDASYEQAGYFRESFENLSEEEKEAILHYVKTDEDFADEFRCWYGYDEFDEEFGE